MESTGIPVTDEEVRKTLLHLANSRGYFKTICPSEVAQALDRVHWRSLMPRVHRVAQQLESDGAIHFSKKGRSVSGTDLKGAYRIGMVPGTRPGIS